MCCGHHVESDADVQHRDGPRGGARSSDCREQAHGGSDPVGDSDAAGGSPAVGGDTTTAAAPTGGAAET